MADDAFAVPSLARIDAPIDDMEKCAWTYRKSSSADARAEAYARYDCVLHQLAELRRDRAKKMVTAAGSALGARAS